MSSSQESAPTLPPGPTAISPTSSSDLLSFPQRPAKRLIICPQDKGGIGKSFAATLLYDYLVDHDASVRAFDLDYANATFCRFVEEAECIDIDVDANRLGVPDRLTGAFDEADVVLADNQSCSGSRLRRFFEETRLPELQDELGLSIIFLVIAVEDKDAISQIADLIDVFQNRVRWLVARNLRDGDNLGLYMNSRTRKKLAGYGAVEIDIPCLAEITREKLQRANLTVGRGRSSDDLYVIDRSRCVRFHDRMEAEFARAGALLLP
ncbi:division plane positioning ATPase MipZ [Geminisphaera colitermitum]|uniref:division plane positioning ATPase MipZ n=1 Tax=Geminisphaera colitermitum TaxID=1148786 RepID=UPI0001964D7A|nr:division plane positioning ATPase MipZ [Geminisphaera colitermitum]